MSVNEAELEKSLELHRTQLSQVEALLASSDGDNSAELVQLKRDMEELIQLTEESLLSLKKSHLLGMLERRDTSCNPSASQSTAVTSNDMDEEFIAFKQAVGESKNDADLSKDNCVESAGSSSDDSLSDSESEMSKLDDDEDDELAGTRCRVKHSHEWGEMTYHNAMIMCIQPPDDSSSDKKVRVLFCNPTHKSMLPCPYFLDGRCNFTDDQCRYSHGEVILMKDLLPFVEPDYSSVEIGSRCLARGKDDLWYPATVVELCEGHKLTVMYDSNHQTATLDVAYILPNATTSASQDQGDSDDNDESSVAVSCDNSDTEELPVYLWRPGQTSDRLGDWEQYTKGIGSKLMAKMGYVVGQGLGKNSDGRSIPVPIQLLPTGKSLDKIMQLKERAGDRDLYDVMKRKTKRKKPNDAKKPSKLQHSSSSVFDFLNKKLTKTSKDSKHSAKHRHNPNVTHVTYGDLAKRTDKHLNIQLFKTAEEMKNTRNEILRLETSLSRNEGQDKVVSTQLSRKLESLKEYLGQLEHSEKALHQQQNTRRAKKALVKF